MNQFIIRIIFVRKIFIRPNNSNNDISLNSPLKIIANKF